MPDQEIVCCECSTPFIFTEGEQAFYAQQKPIPFSPPKRCKSCRAEKKRKNDEREASGNAPPPPADENENRQRSKSNKPSRGGGHW